jgi:flagellar biosynthesis/type III secretory pathway protein FliH
LFIILLKVLKTNNQDKYLASLLSAISTVNQAIEEGTTKATSLTLEVNNEIYSLINHIFNCRLISLRKRITLRMKTKP